MSPALAFPLVCLGIISAVILIAFRLVHGQFISYPMRVALAAALHERRVLPGRFAAWYINRLTERLIAQERRVLWARANLAVWPRRLDEGAPDAAVEAFWIASAATDHCPTVTSYAQRGGITAHVVNQGSSSGRVNVTLEGRRP